MPMSQLGCLGSLAGPPLVGAVVDRHGWEAGLVPLAVLALAAVALIAAALRAPAATPRARTPLRR